MAARIPLVTVEMATELDLNDISELSDAAEKAIDAGGRFWLVVVTSTFCDGKLLAGGASDPGQASYRW